MASSSALLDQYSKGTRAWFPDKQEAWIGADLTEKDVGQDMLSVCCMDSTHMTLCFS